jgi:flagellar basal-body rod protein FlgG
MFEALYIGATGMQAQQLNLDTIANNLANVNTAGFKKSRASFTDLMVRDGGTPVPSYDATEASLLHLPGLSGVGVAVSSVLKQFDIGTMQQTGSAFDLAIQGDGFIEVQMPDGNRGFSRAGTLKVNGNGLLATQDGYPLKPNIRVPDGAQNLTIQSDGSVSAVVGTSTTPASLGQIELVRFSNPQGLQSQGNNLYLASDTSGDAVPTKVGVEGVGPLSQGHLEASNVKMVDEMVNMMVAQRTYEANVKIVQAADDVLGLVNSLRK